MIKDLQGVHNHSIKKGNDVPLAAEHTNVLNYMCALKFKYLEQKTAALKLFEKMTDKEQSLLDLDFLSFWQKTMGRRNMPMVPLLAVVANS